MPHMFRNKHKPICDVCWRTDVQEAPTHSIAIVADILRASTNIVTIFGQGAKQLAAVRDIEEARALAHTHQGLLVGERHNRIIEGFHYGNSPAQLQQVDLKEKTIILTSTNFPHALHAARKARMILIGALVNLDAVSEKAYQLAMDHRCNITLMLAGEPSEKHAFEDLYFGGRVIMSLGDRVERTEASRGTVERTRGVSPQEACQTSIHAGELIEEGFVDDVDLAFDLNCTPIVPQFRDNWITVV